tara:strand:+ start:850 stop:1575 length:726 start_codon:yes stop_codon:yes gene_type:complete
MTIRLGVNIDHVATLRNARKISEPSPFEAAQVVKKSGADQVTIHLREDRRHINDDDAKQIIQNIDLDINLEIGPTEEMINFAINYKPDFVCLVPEKREEITTEGGLNLHLKEVILAIERLKNKNLNVCLFINPTIENIQRTKELDVKYVELHTGNYANNFSRNFDKEILIIKDCAKLCQELKINCNAGHGLNYDNVSYIAKIKEIAELNIGHSIISNSLFFGLENSVKKMINIMKNSREQK